MVKKRLIEAVTATDAKTKRWKAMFAAARLAYSEGEFQQARNLLIRALELAKDIPEKSFAVNSCEVGLGATYLAEGKYADAEKHLRKATSNLESSGDQLHRELFAVAKRFNAERLRELGDARAAENELKDSLAILQELGPDAAVQIAHTLCDLCTLYVLSGRFSEADRYIRDAVVLITASLGQEHPGYIWADMINQICISAKGQDDILTIAGDSLNKLQYRLGQKHPHLVRAMRTYAHALEERGDSHRLEEARATFAAFDKYLNN